MARVAVVGLGAIGTAVAGALVSTARHELLLCSRRPLAGEPQVEVDGCTIEVAGRRSADPAEAVGPADWILLAVKTHQTAGAAAWLEALRGPDSVIVPLQNGVEQAATVEPAAAGARVLPAVVWIGSTLSPPHRATVRGNTTLAVADDETGRAFALLLDGSFVEVRLLDDLLTEAWRKLCTNAVASLQALTGRSAGSFRRPELAELARSLARECVEVGRAEGAKLGGANADEVVAYLAALPPEAQSSILRDRLVGRPLEWDALVGVVRRLGAVHGIPTPVADVVVPLLAAASGE